MTDTAIFPIPVSFCCQAAMQRVDNESRPSYRMWACSKCDRRISEPLPEPATPRNPITLTVTRNTFLGFPLVIDKSIPPGRMEVRLEEDERNQTGQIELHGRSFVAAPGDAIDLFFCGEVVTTIEFTAGTLLDGPLSEPQIGPELQRFVDSLRSTH